MFIPEKKSTRSPEYKRLKRVLFPDEVLSSLISLHFCEELSLLLLSELTHPSRILEYLSRSEDRIPPGEPPRSRLPAWTDP